MFTRKHLIRFYSKPADDGEGAGGGGGNAIAPEVQALIDAAVEKTTAGLKAKNGELLGKLKESSEQLKTFEGIDPTAVRSILSKFASDEEAGLIAKGDIDTVLKKRTERLQADYDKKLGTEAERAAKAEAKAAKLADSTLAGTLRDAAIKTGALPEAMEDIVLRARGLWTLNDDGEAVALDGDGEVMFGKDGKTPLTPSEWAESLRETAPHLWPRAQGAGAQGSGRGNPTQPAGSFGGSKEERQQAIAKRFNLPKG